MTDQSLPVPMSIELAKRLLDALANDDAIRSRFELDPESVLLELGYPLDEFPEAKTQLQALARRIGVGKLADKQTIAAASTTLQASLTDQLKMLPIMLDASDGAAFKRKD